jgi:hypothetical protein
MISFMPQSLLFLICGLVGNYTASCGNYLPTFRDNVSVPSSRVKIPRRKAPQSRFGRFEETILDAYLVLCNLCYVGWVHGDMKCIAISSHRYICGKTSTWKTNEMEGIQLSQDRIQWRAMFFATPNRRFVLRQCLLLYKSSI